jgi:hypothetical protein
VQAVVWNIGVLPGRQFLRQNSFGKYNIGLPSRANITAAVAYINGFPPAYMQIAGAAAFAMGCR